jgi:integrase
MFDLAYFGELRVSEFVSLTWGQVIRGDSGEAQLSIVGKGSKRREVLIPAVIAARLFASRADAPASAPVFQSVCRPGALWPSVPSTSSSRRLPGSSCRVDPLAASRASFARNRQWCPYHARLGHFGPRRPEDHQRLCACPVFEDKVLGVSPTRTRDLTARRRC